MLFVFQQSKLVIVLHELEVVDYNLDPEGKSQGVKCWINTILYVNNDPSRLNQT